ncbi:hypothetical protein [Sodalis glossinidius]|uniref:hypothetical protein n=1 Tax=Sodalis glossinidius TaxID=63612 RepID=UPI000324C0CB|nr:hypothetical protein [Sodalis glossinidius]
MAYAGDGFAGKAGGNFKSIGGEQERKLELQIRELTLLPLNIKFQSVSEFQARGAPKNTVLVITPFQVQLPLYSPPLLQVRMPLPQAQRQRIRDLLES